MLEKLMNIDLETKIFFIVYSIVGVCIVIYLTKKTLEEQKKFPLIKKVMTIIYSIIFGGFIILFPWIAIIKPVIAVLIFAILSIIILISRKLKKKN